MEVIVAKKAGFCFGVEKAVSTAFSSCEEYKAKGIPVYTYGQIIHNEEVIKRLENSGVGMLESLDELENISECAVIIRSHGVSRAEMERITASGNIVIDTTCPFVSHIHKIVDEKSSDGGIIIIIGSHNHPEVEGTKGWCNSEPYIISDESEIENLPDFGDKSITVVGQTTFSLQKFQYLVELLQKKYYNVNVCKTICNATEERQQETADLAKTVDAMIVIGGRNSSNTQKLYDISRSICKNTYYIQTLVDLEETSFESFRRVGITAGASTPNYIIKEVLTRMSEMSFEEMLNSQEEVQIRTGSRVEGTVVSVKPDEIIVDIHYKSEGVITRNEFSSQPNLDLTTVVNVGDPISAKVIKTNDGEGQVLLSTKRIEAEKAYTKLEEAFNSGEILSGKVVQVLSGGLAVQVDACRVFIPASLVSDNFERNLDKYLDQEVEFKLIECDTTGRKKRIIGDRKQIISKKKAEAAEELFSRIEVGQVVEGTVKNVTDFGAFIDLGGADGLLHISEMSWGRVESPKKIFKVGETVRCFIKDINGEKIALSLKFEDQNPWLKAEEKYVKGSVVTGKIARMTDFGAFVVLEPGIDALLHVSQISNERVEKPSDVYKIGDTVTAKVVDFKAADKKISLSVRALQNDTEEDAAEEAAPEAVEEEAPAVEEVAEEVTEEAPAEETVEE
ncbi:MAG: bifunctional 4-hydroxy-3-methylbut-2-enyl diphosphate reductase/30S ribosomal protein S1 [Eubacterium sp.]|nr:bifunctional 4-hydroxy-3-methylbut-2-enyl diphosphate reductase/30S ribosomal protein S1 [Eubacterium sp.]